MRFLLLLLLSTVTFGQTIQERVAKFENSKRYVVEYDKFDKETEISLQTGFRGLSMRLIAYVSDNRKNDRLYLYFSDQFNRPLYNHPTLKFLLDGEQLTIESDEIDYSVMFPLTPEQAERIAKSKTVEMQLQGFETVWDAKTLTAFRNIVSLTKPPPR